MWTSQRIWNWPDSYWSDGAAPRAVAVDMYGSQTGRSCVLVMACLQRDLASS